MFIFNTWQFYLIGYLVFVVIFYQTYKLAVRKAKRDGAATILLQFIAGSSVLLLIPFFTFKIPNNPSVYLLLACACLFYTLNDRMQTTARKHLEVSVFTIINQVSTVILIIYGFIFFRESFILSKIVGALLVIGGNILVFYNKGSFRINKYSLIAIAATFAFATAITIDIGISKQFSLPIYVSITLLLPALLIFIIEGISFKAIIAESNSPARKYYIITGVAWGLAILFSLRAFQLKDVTIIVPLEATSVLLNVILAYFVLNERDSRIKKIVAAILVIVGVSLTVLT